MIWKGYNIEAGAAQRTRHNLEMRKYGMRRKKTVRKKRGTDIYTRRRRERIFRKAAVKVCIGLLAVLAVVITVAAVMWLRGAGKKDEVQTESRSGTETVAGTEEQTETVKEAETEPQKEPQTETETESETETETESESEDDTEKEIQALIDWMPLEDKVAQLFMVTPEALTGYDQVTRAGTATRQAYEKMPVGGIVLMEQNLSDPEELKTMVSNLHSYSRDRTGLPLLVGIDEEGGTVARIGNHEKFDVPDVGDMADVGKGKDVSKAYETGSVLGEYLSDFGIDVDFAPVADVWWNSDNTVVEKRSFGSDPELVSQMVAEAVKGLQEHGVSATLKHFPGHGGTSKDSHDEIASVSETIQEMDKKDLLPFKAGIEAGADQVMIGHICTPKASDEDVPATFSYFWVTEVLRAYLGFEGVAVTDALNMGAITQKYTSAEASVKALQAGADMLLMPENFEEAYQGVLGAVKDGTLKEARVDESLARIFRLKYKKIPQRLPF